jgi:hypothetical protein
MTSVCVTIFLCITCLLNTEVGQKLFSLFLSESIFVFYFILPKNDNYSKHIIKLIIPLIQCKVNHIRLKHYTQLLQTGIQ